MSRRLALLIGNVRYQDGRLHSPVSGKMFTALVDALEDHTSGGFDAVFVLVNKPAVEVQLAIAEFLEESQSPDDLLLLYFTGHALHYQARPYLACWDTFTTSYLDGTTMQADYVRRRLSRHPARHKLIILDCSASPLWEADSLPPDATWLRQAFQSAGISVLAAVQPHQAADPLAHASLTPALVDALRSGEVRLDAAGLAAVVARFSPALAPPEAEPPGAEGDAPPVASEQLERESTGAAAEAEPTAVAVDSPPVAAALAEAENLAAVPDVPEALPEVEVLDREAEIAPVEISTLVLDDTAVAADAPASAQSTRRYALAALAVLLLLLLAGGLYRSGIFSSPAGGLANIPTAAAVVSLPTATPSATIAPTRTGAVTPSPTATTTATETPASTLIASPTHPVISPSPSPTSSPSSPNPLAVHVARQLVYLRSGPAINFRIVDYLAEGTAVTVLGRTPSGEWYNVQLADGRNGWVFSEMVQPAPGADATDIPLVATLPAAVDEFHDFVAQRTEEELIVTVGHVYIGEQGPNALFTAELLPETDLIQPIYENEQVLGLGQFVVRFARVAEGEYTSTAVRLCMTAPDGQPFFCETYSLRRAW